LKNCWWVIAFIFCLGLATLAPLASNSPDGLERVAEDAGFASRAVSAPYALIADYVFPGVDNPVLASITAGWIGTSLLFGVAYLIAFLFYNRRKSRAAR
jgi:cobalt/nickel transport system permease protein